MIEEENSVVEEKKTHDIQKKKVIITQIKEVKFYTISNDCSKLILVDSNNKIHIFNTSNQ